MWPNEAIHKRNEMCVRSHSNKREKKKWIFFPTSINAYGLQICQAKRQLKKTKEMNKTHILLY